MSENSTKLVGRKWDIYLSLWVGGGLVLIDSDDKETVIVPMENIPALRAFLDQHFPQEEKK